MEIRAKQDRKGVLGMCLEAGLDLEREALGGSVWLFGSRAAGCSRRTSDWDLLVVACGEGPWDRRRVGSLDVVTIKQRSQGFTWWLGSELASHVSVFGRLVWGDEQWLAAVDPEEARVRKVARTRGRLLSLASCWRNLKAWHRHEWSVGLRRDIQRAVALRDVRTVPPTRMLDAAWSSASHRERLDDISWLMPDLPEEIVCALEGSGQVSHARRCKECGVAPVKPDTKLSSLKPAKLPG